MTGNRNPRMTLRVSFLLTTYCTVGLCHQHTLSRFTCNITNIRLARLQNKDKNRPPLLGLGCQHADLQVAIWIAVSGADSRSERRVHNDTTQNQLRAIEQWSKT